MRERKGPFTVILSHLGNEARMPELRSWEDAVNIAFQLKCMYHSLVEISYDGIREVV